MPTLADEIASYSAEDAVAAQRAQQGAALDVSRSMRLCVLRATPRKAIDLFRRWREEYDVQLEKSAKDNHTVVTIPLPDGDLGRVFVALSPYTRDEIVQVRDEKYLAECGGKAPSGRDVRKALAERVGAETVESTRDVVRSRRLAWVVTGITLGLHYAWQFWPLVHR